MKEVVKMFIPILIVIGGGLIMVAAGVNDLPHVSSIFQAMAEMKWFGWIGVAFQLFGILMMARLIRIKWLS